MVKVQDAKIEEFRGTLEGQVILPDDAGYDDARTIWNAMIDKRPALIARCAGTSDVVQAVNFARDYGLPLAIRGGGHNIAGSALCDGGLVVDLSRMKEARVDPAATPRDHRGRRHPGRSRRGHPALRPGHAGRHQLHHRHRRADPGWRIRLAQPQVRHDRRQPRLGRGRDRRRGGRDRQRDGEPGPVLGPPRRRRQLRRGHPLRVPAPSRRPGGAERPHRLSDRRGEVGPAAVPQVHRHGPRRAHRVGGHAQGAAVALPSRIGAWDRSPGAGPLLRRRYEAGRDR